MHSVDQLVDLLGGRFGPADRLRPDVVELARQERLLPAVGAALVRAGWAEVPVSLADHLVGAHRTAGPETTALVALALNRRRNLDLADQLSSVLTALAQAGTAALPLKGAALLELDPSPTRELTDLDLLVLDRPELAQEVLLGAGYRPAADYRHVEFLPDDHQLHPVLAAGRAGSVEIHRQPLQTEYSGLFPVHLIERELIEGPTGPRLSPFALALHTVLHARVVDNSYRRLRPALRSAVDIVTLTRVDPRVPDRLDAYSRTASPLVRHAIALDLYLAGRIDPALAGRGPWRARWWWWRVRRLLRHPRAHRSAGALAMVWFSLERRRMDHRAGRRLAWWELAWHRAAFVRARARSFLREGE